MSYEAGFDKLRIPIAMAAAFSPNAAHPLAESLSIPAIVIPDQRIITADQALRNLGIQIGDEVFDEPIEDTTERDEVAGVMVEGDLPAEGEVESPTVVPEVVVPPSVIKPENPQNLVPDPEAAPPPPVVEQRPVFNPNGNPIVRQASAAEAQSAPGFILDSAKAHDLILPAYTRLLNADNRVFQSNIDEGVVMSTIVFDSAPSTPLPINLQTLRFEPFSVGKGVVSDSRRILNNERGQGSLVLGLNIIHSDALRGIMRLDTKVMQNPILGEMLKRIDPSINPDTTYSFGFGVIADNVALEPFSRFDNTVVGVLACEFVSPAPRIFAQHITDSPDIVKYKNLLIRGGIITASELHDFRANGNFEGLAKHFARKSKNALGQPVGPEVSDTELVDYGLRIMNDLGQPRFSGEQIGAYFPAARSIIDNVANSTQIC